MDKKKWEQENVLRLVKKSRKGVLRVVFSRFGLMALLLILELVLLWMMWRWFNNDFEWFAAAQGVFTVLMFFHLFNSDMDATGKLTWMFLLAVIPIPASIFLWFTEKDVGHRTLKRRVQQRIDESRDLLHQDPEVLRDPEIESSGTDDLCRYLNRSGSFPLYANTETKFFPQGEDKFAALLEELQKAEKFIFLEYFIIDEGYMWGSILKILADKAAQGVDVRVLYDGMLEISTLPWDYPRRLEKLGVRWVHDRAVSVLTTAGAVQAVTGEKGEYPCRAAVLATGGVSYPGTGSTGDGYRIAGELGHTIVAPHGSLVPLVSEDTCCGIMQGLALKNVQLTAVNEKKKTVFSEFGEMLFTHFGVSGPLVLSASAHLRDWDKHTYSLSIDLKPALSEEKLEERLLRELREQSNRNMENVLLSLVPTSMVPVLCTRLHIDPELKANSFKKEQRRALLQELKHFTLSVSGPRPVAEAIVTSGGVKVGEVNPGTMESKLITGLYFAGEILDVDAYTGGFNLQIAWSTGRAAGLAAAEEEGER